MNETARPDTPRPLKVFISYSHKDEGWREKLDAHLALLKRQGIFAVWHDRKLLGGEDWAKTIDEELERADIVLLLISADFINSDYCFGLEMTRAMERHEAGAARVVPILIRKCHWESAVFAKCQAFPRDNKPIASHPDGEDAALTEVTKELSKLAEEMMGSRSVLAGANRKPAVIYRPKTWWQRHGRHLLVGGAVVLLLACAGAIGAVLKSREALRDGQRELRLGAYERAKAQFETALRWNPFSADGRRGERLAGLGGLLPDMEGRAADFAGELRKLEGESPGDPVVRLFVGDQAFDAYRRGRDQQKLVAAAAAYRDAAQDKEDFPEAHARLGFLADFAGNLEVSEQAWRKAIEQSRGSSALAAPYRSGLADVLAQLGRTDEALRLYDGDPEYPRSGIQVALLRWQASPTPDALGQARDRLTRASDQLTGNAPASAWGFKVGEELILLGRREAQRCLAQVALTATDDMLDDKPGEANPLQAADCRKVGADIKLVICDRLARARAAGNARSEAAGARLGCTGETAPPPAGPATPPRQPEPARRTQT